MCTSCKGKRGEGGKRGHEVQEVGIMCTSWGGEGGEDIDRSENMRGWMKGMMKDGTEMKGVHEVQEGAVEGTS